MPRQISTEEVIQLSAKIVRHWLAAPQRAKELCIKFGLSAEAADFMTNDMRGMIGGEEVYLAAADFLRSVGKCPRCGGDGVEPAPDPKRLDAVLCSGSIPVPCDECSGHGTVESEDADSTTVRGAQG
jgi:hypothetical protein